MEALQWILSASCVFELMFVNRSVGELLIYRKFSRIENVKIFEKYDENDHENQKF